MTGTRWKAAIKAVLPPVVLIALGRKPWSPFHGDYDSFEEAAKHAVGYDDAGAASAAAGRLADLIAAPNPVEIDGRFQQVHSALCIAQERLQKPRITVLDVGGGNGNYFFRLEDYFPEGALDWHVVETAHMVDACAPIGGRHVSYLKEIPPDVMFDVAIVSGALQYLPDAYKWLTRIAQASRWIILTRLPVHEGEKDKFMVQTVPAHIHVGSMPIEIFSASKMRAAIDVLGSVAMSWLVALDESSLAPLGAKPVGYLIETRNAPAPRI